MSQNKVDVDVVIVGAGFAGLAAADAIVQYNQVHRDKGMPEVTFVVLEGSDRAGGRTKTIEIVPDLGQVGYLDVGGQYLGRGQSYVQALVDRFNISTFPTCVAPDKLSVYQAGDIAESQIPQLTYFAGNYPLTATVIAGLKQIDSRTQFVKAALSEPWTSLQAKSLDNQTVETWATPRLGDDAYAMELTKLAIRCAFSVEWDQLSALYLFFYGATAGSFEAFENVTGEDGGDRIRFTHGTKSLVDALVGAITDAAPGSIQYGCRVREIAQSGSGIEVTTETSGGPKVWEASRVIVAMSPKPSADIVYSPPLSKDRIQFANNMVMGKTIKGFLLYREPWWRMRFTGYVLSGKGPACWIMDNTWQDPYTGALGQPSLMTFVAGQFADQRFSSLKKEERRDKLKQQVFDIFQDKRALEPIGYVESDWQNDEWSRGCPAAVPGLGDLASCGPALRSPCGPIHWAGSESGLEWTGGYMNGAVQSGVRAAGEAIDAMLAMAAAPAVSVFPAAESAAARPSNTKNTSAAE